MIEVYADRLALSALLDKRISIRREHRLRLGPDAEPIINGDSGRKITTTSRLTSPIY